MTGNDDMSVCVRSYDGEKQTYTYTCRDRDRVVRGWHDVSLQ